MSTTDLVPLMLPVGLMCEDQSAIVGPDGHLHLFKGRNNIADLYSEAEDSASVKARLSKWRLLFANRHARFSECNVTYLQVVIPEKSSVVIAERQIGLGPITPLFRQLETALAETHAAEWYLSVVDQLRAMLGQTYPPYLRTDSHLTVHGCREVFLSMLRRLGQTVPGNKAQFDHARALAEQLETSPSTKIYQGDLASRFGVVGGFWEHVFVFDTSGMAHLLDKIEEKVVAVSPDGRHNGMHISWRNPSAPLKLKIVAVANSFFERGGSMRSLSWWFKCFFEEFDFIWTGAVDFSALREMQPDIVICQTVERFLAFVPPT